MRYRVVTRFGFYLGEWFVHAHQLQCNTSPEVKTATHQDLPSFVLERVWGAYRQEKKD